MEILQVVLLESVGKIKFGMTKDKVRELYELKREFIKSRFSNNSTDDLGFCHVYYNADGRCEAVEVFDDAEVFIDGRKIFPISLAEAKDIENTLEEDDEGMLSVNMSIGIYAPDGKMESILFGEKGYYK